MKQLYIILVLSIGAMVFFAIALLFEFNTIRQGQVFYEELYLEVYQNQNQLDEHLSPVINASLPKLVEPTMDILVKEDNSNEEFQIIETETIETKEIVEESIKEPTIFTSIIDFDTLKENYPTLVAWIKSENINYPIVQGKDNNYYLSRLPNGKHHVMGSIFLDYRNLKDFSEQCIILYGHDSRKGDMFGSLKHYANQEYYEQNSSMFIFTPECDYKLILIAGYIIDSAIEVPPMNFSDSTDLARYVTDIKSRSIFKSDSSIEINYDDQLVYLATCTPTGSINDRLIIVGKLVWL